MSAFAPDSVYAEWTLEQREISDRMEADYNRQANAHLALVAAERGHPITVTTDCPDSMLRSLSKTYWRELEDLSDLQLAESTAANRSRKRVTRERALQIRIADIEREQYRRSVLAECWQAREDGTHCYSDFAARGGLLAVIDHGARPPSYELAVLLDWEQWKLGEYCVLAWEA